MPENILTHSETEASPNAGSAPFVQRLLPLRYTSISLDLSLPYSHILEYAANSARSRLVVMMPEGSATITTERNQYPATCIGGPNSPASQRQSNSGESGGGDSSGVQPENV